MGMDPRMWIQQQQQQQQRAQQLNAYVSQQTGGNPSQMSPQVRPSLLLSSRVVFPLCLPSRPLHAHACLLNASTCMHHPGKATI